MVLCAALLAVSCSKNEPPKEAAKEAPKGSSQGGGSQGTGDAGSVQRRSLKQRRAASWWRSTATGAPRGADRFRELVKNGFYEGGGFFRVIKGFMVQFGPELGSGARTPSGTP